MLSKIAKRKKAFFIATTSICLVVAMIWYFGRKPNLAKELQTCIDKVGNCRLTISNSGKVLSTAQQAEILPAMFKNLSRLKIRAAGPYNMGTQGFVGLIYPEGSRHRLVPTSLMSLDGENQFSLGALIRSSARAETDASNEKSEYYFDRLSDVIGHVANAGVTFLDDETFQPVSVEKFVEARRIVFGFNKDQPAVKKYWEDPR